MIRKLSEMDVVRSEFSDAARRGRRPVVDVVWGVCSMFAVIRFASGLRGAFLWSAHIGKLCGALSAD